MRLLTGTEAVEAMRFIDMAAAIALKATCLRARAGSVIVRDGVVIGEGFNSPPGGEPLAECRKDSLPKEFKSDRTCCVHAEQRAIMDALRMNPDKLQGSRLYFIRLDEAGDKAPAGAPYCTICSKMALDAGITEFVLLQADGIRIFDTGEYNKLSFRFRG